MKLSKKDAQAMNKIYKEIEETTIMDKKILNSIDKEKSIIGKELLICEQLHIIERELPNKEASSQLILYLIRLLKYNNQVHDSIKKELSNDKKLLKSRVNKAFSANDIHQEIYNSVLKIADKHFNLGRKHMKKFKVNDSKTHHHAQYALHHKTKAEDLYDTLMGKDIKKVIKQLALTKLSEIYTKMNKKGEETSSLIIKTVKKLEKGNKVKTPIHDINKNILEQNLALRHFATNYSKTLIHSAEYIDNLSNKIILYHHK